MVHTLRLDNYYPTPRKLVLGTNSSFGTESIKIERGAGWDGLNLTATWHIPGREEPLRVALLDGDAMDVPPEVTKEAKDGVLVLAGLASGVQRASCNVEYLILEQAGVYGGADAEPTPELAAQVLKAALQAKADAEAAAEDAAAAKANADKAQQAAENAAADAAKAGPYAEAARAAQEAAESARDEAIAAQRAAENAAAAAAASKSAADTLAAEAARAAQAAENSKTTANNAANFAGENATAAQQAAATATAAANDAGQGASDAAASKAASETAAKAAQDAQTAAAAAKAEAVKAQEAAQTAAKSAQDAQAAAEKVRDDAKAAQKGAEDARDAAAKSAEAAAKSEANAKQSADTLAESVENVVANTAAVAELKQQVKNITPDDSTIGGKPWSSKHIIDMLCPPLEESGNPVVCYPVAGYPLGVKASWEPVQEGSGTPYPAGGGKNQLNPAEYEAATKTINGITFTRLNTGEVVVSGTATGTAIYALIKSFSYSISLSTKNNWSIVGENVISAQGLVSGVTVLRPSDNTSLYIRVASGTTVKTTVQPQIEKGNTPTAWAPYENIRPIKGRDSVTVERCGENLLNIKPFKKDTYKGITYEYVPDGGIHISGTATASGDSPIFPIWHLPPGKYYGLETGEEIFASIVVQRNGKNLWINAKKEFTILAGDVTKYLYMITSTGVTVDKTVYPYIVPGTTPPTVYTPYTGQTNTLTLPKTVYGGEVDAVTGEGMITKSCFNLDDATNWEATRYTENNDESGYGFMARYPGSYGDGKECLCSHLPYSCGITSGRKSTGILVHENGQVYVRVKIDGVNSVETWIAYLAAQKTAGTPVQACYKLGYSVPFTATGAKPLPAITGVNTVLTDADSTTVTGRADPIKRIEDLEAAVASIN